MRSGPRILVIRLGAVGDVVRTMTVLEPLRRLHPDAHICWIVEDGPAQLLAGHPLLDEVIVLPRKRLGELLSSPDTFFHALDLAGKLALELRRRGFDIALDFQGTFKSGLVSFASGAPRRYGYAPPGSKEGNRFFNTHHVRLPGGPVHRVERNLALARALGASADRVHVEFPARVDKSERVERWLAEAGLAHRRRIVICPGASRRQAYKRYPADRLALVVRKLSEEIPHALIVASGPGEEDLANEVSGGAPGRAVVAAHFDLLELAELIRRCELFIGADTGPMHIAWAVGTRVLAVFGPTDPALNAPWGEGHTVLYNGASRGRHDFSWTSAERVASSAVSMVMESQQ